MGGRGRPVRHRLMEHLHLTGIGGHVLEARSAGDAPGPAALHRLVQLAHRAPDPLAVMQGYAAHRTFGTLAEHLAGGRELEAIVIGLPAETQRRHGAQQPAQGARM